MRRLCHYIACALLLGMFLFPGVSNDVALAANAAQDIFSNTQVTNPTGVDLIGGGGMAAPGDVRGFAMSLIRIVINAISVIAVLAIVVVGVRMVTSVEGDDQVATQRKILLGIIVGLVVMNIAEPVVSTLYQQNAVVPGGDSDYSRVAAMRFQRDIVEPMINFAMTFIAGIAVFMIMVAGVRIVMSTGDESKIKEQQFVLVESIMGLFIIVIAQPIVKAVYGYQAFTIDRREFVTPDLGFGIQVLVQVMNYILSFFFLGALAMLIYAGFLMVGHFGQSDLVDRGKKIIRYTIISIIIAISAYTIVAWLVTLTP